MAEKCARTFSIVVEKGKKSILDVTHLLPDALPRSVRDGAATTHVCCSVALSCDTSPLLVTRIAGAAAQRQQQRQQ